MLHCHNIACPKPIGAIFEIDPETGSGNKHPVEECSRNWSQFLGVLFCWTHSMSGCESPVV